MPFHQFRIWVRVVKLIYEIKFSWKTKTFNNQPKEQETKKRKQKQNKRTNKQTDSKS